MYYMYVDRISMYSIVTTLVTWIPGLLCKLKRPNSKKLKSEIKVYTVR